MIRPRSLRFRGVIHPIGYVFVPGLAAQQRILAQWRPGCRLYESDLGWVLWLDEPETARAPWIGLPIVSVDGVPTTVPLAADERTLVVPPNCFASPLGGVLEVFPCQSAIDPSEWLDLDLLATELRPLGHPDPIEAPPAPVTPPLTPDTFGVGEAPSELGALLEILEGDEPDRTSRVHGLVRDLSAADAGALDAAMRAAGVSSGPTLWETLRGLFVAGADRERLADAMLSSWSDGSEAIARAVHDLDESIERFLDELSSLDIDDALRRAIPIGGGPSSDRARPWSPPARRERLTPSLESPRPGARPPLADRLYDRLRDTYRRLADDLERDGEFEKAAFVFVDLLREPNRAVAMLEAHECWRLAAQIADAHHLPPGQRVRLWWLAGEREHAIDIAIAHDAFADALVRLRDEPALQIALRTTWADRLASIGRFAEATDLLAHLGARGPMKRWLENTIAEGGSDTPLALARWLDFYPEELDAVSEELDELIRAPLGTSGLRDRLQLAAALVTTGRGTAARAFGHRLLRALAREVPALDATEQALYRQLEKHIDDAAFSGDRPRVPRPSKPVWPLRVDRSQRGTLALLDAALLPSRRCLVALGAAGVIEVDLRSGELRAHYEAPANHLVVAPSGNQALALSVSEDRTAIHRLHLGTQEVTHWPSMRLRAWSRRFDGLQWLVAIDNTIQLIATDRPRPAVLWEPTTPPGTSIRQLDSGTGRLHALVDGRTPQVLTWSGTSPFPSAREVQHSVFEGTRLQAALDTDRAGYVVRLRGEDGSERYRLWVEGGITLGLGGIPVGNLVIRGDLLACAVHGPQNTIVTLASTGSTPLSTRVLVQLTGHRQVALRFCGRTLVVTDREGSLLLLDPDHGLIASWTAKL